jgi:cholesterol transport system auxiliary component
MILGTDTMRGIARRTSTIAALALLSASLSGCLGLGGKPPKHLITLTPESIAAAGPLGSGRLSEAIVVLDPQADRRVDVLRIPVQVDDSNLAYMTDVAWVEKPVRQFRHLLAETIRAKGNRLVLEEVDEQAGAKLRLGGRLVDMGYDARSQSVVVRFDAMRDDGSGNITSRRFEALVPGIAPKAEQVAPALNKAANQVAKEVADWVG